MEGLLDDTVRMGGKINQHMKGWMNWLIYRWEIDGRMDGLLDDERKEGQIK